MYSQEKRYIDTDKEQECVNALLQSQNYNRVHIFLALQPSIFVADCIMYV